MTDERAYVQVDHVGKRFANVPVLRDVSVRFARGQIHGLVGKNGSGKTWANSRWECASAWASPRRRWRIPNCSSWMSR